MASSLVRKMRSPQTAGVPAPMPGSAAFHSTFFVSLHSVGMLDSRLTASWCAPRHWGQFSARQTVAVSSRARAAGSRLGFMSEFMTELGMGSFSGELARSGAGSQ